MDEIRSWWEIPCIAHFCHIFSKPFKLVEFEIEELEDTLLLDEMKENPTPSLLVKLYCALLNGIVDKEVTEENWEFFLKMHIQWRNDHLDENWNPHKDKVYKDLDSRTKVEILHKMIHWRLELDDIGDLLRGLDGLSLRVEPIGKDEDGNVYWYFYGTRLYLETPKKKPQRKSKQDQGKGRGKGKGTSKGKSFPPDGEEEKEKDEEEGGVWKMACSTIEDWEELVEELSNCRRGDGRKLYNYLNNELLPDVLYSLQQKERIFKKKLLAEMPRRTSDRIAQKAILKEEEIMEALVREQQREEQRKLEAEEKAKREEEAERRHNEKMEEVIRRRKAKEEEQTKLRQEEEKNWSLAMSGELSGPRQAALGAVQGVVETQHLIDVDDKDEVLHTAMYKVLTGLRRHEDAWVFEEPVSEDIAPGYFEVVEKPMDFQTVEKGVEAGKYTTKDKFIQDIELIFGNCKIYNGEDSEYGELAEEMTQSFYKLMSEHFVEEVMNKDDEEEINKKGKKKRSPSPELTSESSEESEDEDELEDEDEDTPERKKNRKQKNKHLFKPMMEGGVVRPNMVMPQRMYPPHMMQQGMGMRPIPPEMMGYPPRYPYGQAPPYPQPHPMHMRPPREMFYPPSHEGYQRYPYPMNGPPPPYRPSMYPPDHPMGHPMGRPMGMPPGSHPTGHPGPHPAGHPGSHPVGHSGSHPMGHPGPHPVGPPGPHPAGHPGPHPAGPPGPHPTGHPGPNPMGPPGQHSMGPPGPHPIANGPLSKVQPSQEMGERGNGQRVSSPRVSSTVQTPPTSGDEKIEESDKKEANLSSSATDETSESKETQQQTQSMARHQPRPPPNQPHPPYNQYPPPYNQPHPSHYPPHGQPHPYQNWSHQAPPPQMMNDPHYQAMMAAHQQQQQQMAAAAHHGYPPPEHMWNGQRPPYPYGGPTPQQMAMMERQRQAYYEYQMKMRMRASGQTPPTGPPRPSSSGSNHKSSEDASDYYNSSLSNYTKGEDKGSTPTGNEEGKEKEKEKSEQDKKETSDDGNSSCAQEEQENSTEKKSENNEEKGNERKQSGPTPVKPTKPHPPYHQWPPHPSQYPMAPNGYANQMPSHPYPGMGHAPHMYGGPHPQRMPYPPDASMYGNNPSGRGYSPQDMERWQYMEMQRQQWMMHQYHQHQRNSSHTPPTNKRPLAPPPSQDAGNTELPRSMEEGAPPPPKQTKVSEEQQKQINGTAGNET